ncbi:MAG: NUDIX domain-containing protein [Chloroflexota bacterium]
MTLRPDIAACWLFRVQPGGALELLLIRRAPGHAYPGLWQCVTGKIESGERIVDAALREVLEETGLTSDDLENLLETDIVNTFHEARLDALLVEVAFAARVRPGAEVRLSDEHDDARWLSPADARALVTWPAYERGIDFVTWLAAHPDREPTFRLR